MFLNFDRNFREDCSGWYTVKHRGDLLRRRHVVLVKCRIGNKKQSSKEVSFYIKVFKINNMLPLLPSLYESHKWFLKKPCKVLHY